MVWQSFDDFLHMGGYGLYVWASFGVTLGAMAIEIALLRAAKKAGQA